jgi:transcriptional regulator with PAS, ATPase and Fis domain
MSLTLRRRNVGMKSALKLLDDASEAIQFNRDLLESALDQVRQGIAVFDKDMHLICWNRQLREIVQLPAELVHFGAPLSDIVRHTAARSDLHGTPLEEFISIASANTMSPWRRSSSVSPARIASSKSAPTPCPRAASSPPTPTSPSAWPPPTPWRGPTRRWKAG